MTTTVTLHDEAYPVVGHAEAGIFEYGTDRAIADGYAEALTGKGRLIDPDSDPVEDEDADWVRDEKHNRIYD